MAKHLKNVAIKDIGLFLKELRLAGYTVDYVRGRQQMLATVWISTGEEAEWLLVSVRMNGQMKLFYESLNISHTCIERHFKDPQKAIDVISNWMRERDG